MLNWLHDIPDEPVPVEPKVEQYVYISYLYKIVAKLSGLF